MPRRIRTPGFDDTPQRNEFLRYPGGNMLLSDVSQAREAMQFGGDAGTPRTATPWVNPRTTTGEPQVQIWNDRTEGGVLHWNGRPIVESAVEIDPAHTGQDTYDSAQPFFSLPHQAMDFPGTPTYQPTESQFDELPTTTYGEPTVVTPTATPSFQSAGNLDAEPSLFPGGSVNPFDEWWKAGMEPTVTGDVSGGSQLNLSGDGGNIWAEMTAPTAQGMVSMSPQESFGAGLTAEPETSFNPVPEPTGVPVEPSIVNQNVGDVEWTTSPEERRFLPGSEPTQSANAGGDISSFGTFGSPLTLGQVFNAPLASLRYGEGYPDIGHVYSAGTEDTTGTTLIDQGEGLTDRELADRHEQEIRNNASNPRPEQSNDPFNTPSVGDMHLYFGDQPLSPGAYDRATFGGLRPTGYRDTRGSATFDSHAANLRLMDFMAFGGAPNRYSPDMPSTFYRGHYRLDDFGGFEQVSNLTSGVGPGVDTSGNWWAEHAGRSSGAGGRGRGG